jgi:hypothetical protein
MSLIKSVVIKSAQKTAAQAGAACTVTVPASSSPVGCFRLLGIKLKLDGAATTTTDALTVTKDSVNGADYDSVIYSVTRAETGAVTSICWAPVAPQVFVSGDACIVSFTHTDAVKASLEVEIEV